MIIWGMASGVTLQTEPSSEDHWSPLPLHIHDAMRALELTKQCHINASRRALYWVSF